MKQAAAGAPVSDRETCMVSGILLFFIRLGVAATIISTSFRNTRNPWKALALLRALIKERRRIHENAGQYKAVKCGKRYYWSANLPGWPSEAFKNFISNEFKRIHTPERSSLQTIIFAITNTCPLHCIHCYEWDNIEPGNRLSMANLQGIMNKILASGIRHIQFTGGEPLSRFDDMIELMKSRTVHTDFWINTSGYGLTPEKARTMKRNGMTGAVISLDDWNEAGHNNFRNNGKSFYWVIEAARNCRDAGIIVCLSVCPVREFVTEENLDRYHTLAKSLGAGFVRILEPRKTGRFSGKDVLLESRQVAMIERFMISRNSNPAYRNYPIVQFPGHHQRKSGCLGSGNRYLYIDPNGDFHACPFCRNPLGSSLTASVEEAAARARKAGCHLFKQRLLE